MVLPDVAPPGPHILKGGTERTNPGFEIINLVGHGSTHLSLLTPHNPCPRGVTNQERTVVAIAYLLYETTDDFQNKLQRGAMCKSYNGAFFSH